MEVKDVKNTEIQNDEISEIGDAENTQVGQDITAGEMGLLGSRKLTVPQAAKAMGIGQTNLREILRQGKIPVIRILGKILMLEQDLENYLKGNYGALKQAVTKPTKGLHPLPEHIRNSSLLKKSI